MSNVFIVATPIGNLEDFSPRAIKVLSEVNLVLSEDTRVSKKLLSHFGINTPLESYHQHSGDEKKLFILRELLDGKSIALISDAGTPGISDPGNELIDFIYENTNEVSIIPIPGASAEASALSVCGFNVVPHLFLGFWPKKKVNKTIELVKNKNITFVYFDSPYRVLRNLMTIEKALGSHKRVYIGRELTKMHETHYRGEIKEVIEKLNGEKHLKGEIVVVVE